MVDKNAIVFVFVFVFFVVSNNFDIVYANELPFAFLFLHNY